MNAAPTLAFDIETAPDAEGLRALYDFPAELSAAEVVEMAQRLRRQEKNTDFMPLLLQRVVVISCVVEKGDALNVVSLEGWEDERGALQKFFSGMEKLYREYPASPPRLVSWNGGGFDLPVLNYRAMIHGVRAPLYWSSGDRDANFRFNRTYQNRYNGERHLDLMDALAMFQPRAAAKLGDTAKLCGLPGKMGIGGAEVGRAFAEGRCEEIREYCECDAMLTYLLFLRYQQFSCERGEGEIARKLNAAKKYMEEAGGKWAPFLECGFFASRADGDG